MYRKEKPLEILYENIHAPKRMLIMTVGRDGIALWKLQPAKTKVTTQSYLSFLEENLQDCLTHHQNLDELESNIERAVNDLNKNHLVKRIQKLLERWRRGIDCKG